MTQRLRRAARAGDSAAISALLRLSIRQNDAVLLAEALAAWRSSDPLSLLEYISEERTDPVVLVAEWLVSEEARAVWPLREALIRESKKHCPMLAADIDDLFGEEAPFVLIRPGTVFMGSSIDDDDEFVDLEEHQYQAEITRHFLMGKTPVTQKEWCSVMGKNPSFHTGDQHPVERITWFDALAFCNTRSEQQGIEPAYRILKIPKSEKWLEHKTAEWSPHSAYRLPTEAEWEYTCRAGVNISTEPSSPEELDAIAWFEQNSFGKTHPVAEKNPNRWGLFDMLGNVDEWCWDQAVYDGDTPKTQVLCDPQGRPSDPEQARIARGLSFEDNEERIRAAHRFNAHDDFPSEAIGIRCSRSLTAPPQLCTPQDIKRFVEALQKWHETSASAVAEWIGSRKSRFFWPHRDALIAGALETRPALAANIRDLLGEEAPFVLVRPGKFIMGSPKDEPRRHSDERLHEAEITRHFVMSKLPMTQTLWQELMSDSPVLPSAKTVPNLRGPSLRSGINWFEASACCNALSEKHHLTPAYRFTDEADEGALKESRTAFNSDSTLNVEWLGDSGYRLPTSAEWEYACRAGTSTMAYVPDEEWEEFQKVLGYGNGIHERDFTNPWGLVGMLGYLPAWCWDKKKGSRTCRRTYRGWGYPDPQCSQWKDADFQHRSACVGHQDPARDCCYHLDPVGIGFRCVRSI